jgi:hypothetical protein
VESQAPVGAVEGKAPLRLTRNSPAVGEHQSGVTLGRKQGEADAEVSTFSKRRTAMRSLSSRRRML